VGGPSSDLLSGRRLVGAVLGVRGQLGQLQYELFLSGPIQQPATFKTASTVAGFSLNVSF
jgi:hemolysin activation/secretion protein